MSSLKKSLELELVKLSELKRTTEFFTSEVHKTGTVSALGTTLTDFTNWDVLDLSSERSIKKAFQKAAEETGLSPYSSRSSTGTSKYHTACEERLAQFFGAESALLFSSRSQAMLSLIAALATEKDLILYEEQATCPAIDAGFLVNAETRSFAGTVDEIAPQFANTELFQNVFTVLDSVSLTSGAVISPKTFLPLAKQIDADVIVDESFAVGALGLRGAGVFEEVSTASEIFCKISDLSSILGCWCACLSGSKTLIDYLKTRSRTFKFEAAPPSPVAAAIEAAINVVELKHPAREKLNLLGASLKAGLEELGLKTPAESAPHIQSIELSNINQCFEYRDALINKGLLADALASGRLFSETGILRFVLHSEHTTEDINKLLDALSLIRGRTS